MFINIEVISFKESIVILTNSKPFNITDLEKCRIGRKLLKQTEG